MGVSGCVEQSWAAVKTIAQQSQGFLCLGIIALFLVLVAGYIRNRGPSIRQLARRAEQPQAPSSPTKGAVDRADTTDLSLLFPPSRRHVLPLMSMPAEAAGLSTEPISAHLLRERALPTTRTLAQSKDSAGNVTDSSCDHTYYSPTGVTLQEIRALLGTFPDYAALSGVRHPQPCPSAFDLARARFRPFRPFRWRYHQHMALTKLDPDYWLELEHNYKASLATRQALLARHGERILFHGAGADTDLACRELMEMVLQFLCKRYSQFFSLEDAGENTAVFVNRILDTRTVVSGDCGGVHPLRVVFDNVPEDFAVMLRNDNPDDAEEHGRYFLRAAAVCSSVGWEVGQHRDKPLREIHAEVADYAAKMARSMDRYFARLPTDQPIQRGSWSVEDWEPLFWSAAAERAVAAAGGRRGSGAGADDRKSKNNDEAGESGSSSGGGSSSGSGGDVPWARSRFAAQPDAVALDDLRLRCDWQTLRRLPLTGAVAFNFKATHTPLAALRDEPFVPALLHRVLQDGPAHLVVPGKCMAHTRAVALPALASWAAEQVDAGVVPADWEVRTLDEAPFYPGWKERWHAQQGF